MAALRGESSKQKRLVEVIVLPEVFYSDSAMVSEIKDAWFSFTGSVLLKVIEGDFMQQLTLLAYGPACKCRSCQLSWEAGQ